MKDIVQIGKILDLSQYDVQRLVESRKISLQELENKTILIKSIDTFKNTKYNKTGIKARIIIDNEEKYLVTTSMIIVKQLLDI